MPVASLSCLRVTICAGPWHTIGAVCLVRENKRMIGGNVADFGVYQDRPAALSSARASGQIHFAKIGGACEGVELCPLLLLRWLT